MPLLLLVEAEPIPDAAQQGVRGSCHGSLGLTAEWVGPADAGSLLPEGDACLSADAVLAMVRALGVPHRMLVLVARELRSVRGAPITGQAERGGYVGIVTTYPLPQSGEAALDERVLARFVRGAAHEVGHLGGLGHCGRATCLMNPMPGSSPPGPDGTLLCPTCTPLWEHSLLCWDG